MLHPSYSDLMKVVNADVEPGETKVVNSRYSIVMATAKRARQLVDGEEPLVATGNGNEKPLSIAVEELNEGQIKIIADDELDEFEAEIKEQAAEKAKEIMEERAEAARLAAESGEVIEIAEDDDDEEADDEDAEEEAEE